MDEIKCAMPGCNNLVGKTKLGKWKVHCSLACRGKHNSIKGTEKRKQTCLEKFGATTNLKSESTRNKIKNTLMEKYGVEHQMHIQSVKDKVKNTCIETYGFDNPSKSPEIKDKKVQAYIDHYGVDHPLRSEDVQNKRKENSLLKYGVDHYSKTQEFLIGHKNQSHITPDNYKRLKDPDWLISQSGYSCSYIADMLGVTKDTVAKSFRRLGIDHSSSTSAGELQIADYIKSVYTGNVNIHSRKIIAPREIDIFLPDINLAIEYNGVYWHSESNGKDKNYHLTKTNECKSKNIRLIQILDIEWEYKQEIVKSRLNGFLGLNNIIYARKCQIVELNTTEYINFFNKTHIQLSANATVCYGLMYGGELVAAMSFVKSRFNNSAEWELLRFSNKLFTTVIGGASKLFSHFCKKNIPTSIISYSDKRWNTGKIYQTLGFNHLHDSTPNFWYTKNYIDIQSRLKYQKHKQKAILEKYDENLSAWENMQINGYDRIWDCGNSSYIWRTI